MRRKEVWLWMLTCAGEQIKYEKPYYVQRTDLTPASFEDRERMCRPAMDQLSAEERKDNLQK